MGFPPLLRHLNLCPPDIPLSDTRPLPNYRALTQFSNFHPKESNLGPNHISGLCPIDIHWQVFPWVFPILVHYMEHGAFFCDAGRTRNSTCDLFHRNI